MYVLGVGCAPLPPLLADEVGVVQPGFVDVDDAFLRLQQLYHLVSELLPQDHILVSVSGVTYALDGSIAHAQSILQDSTHQLICDTSDSI